MEYAEVALFNIKELIQKSNYVQSFCVNYRERSANLLLEWHHHLPLKNDKVHYLDTDNWNLPEEVGERISSYLDELGQYADSVRSDIMANNMPPMEQVPAPWILFPLYPRDSLGWRMGAAEDYCMAYNKFLLSLSEEEIERYRALYPEPQYFEPPVPATTRM